MNRIFYIREQNNHHRCNLNNFEENPTPDLFPKRRFQNVFPDIIVRAAACFPSSLDASSNNAVRIVASSVESLTQRSVSSFSASLLVLAAFKRGPDKAWQTFFLCFSNFSYSATAKSLLESFHNAVEC